MKLEYFFVCVGIAGFKPNSVIYEVIYPVFGLKKKHMNLLFRS